MYENQPKSSVKPNEHEHTFTQLHTKTHTPAHVQCLVAKWTNIKSDRRSLLKRSVQKPLYLKFCFCFHELEINQHKHWPSLHTELVVFVGRKSDVAFPCEGSFVQIDQTVKTGTFRFYWRWWKN